MENFLLGCDWGTSSFRLGLYSLEDGVLIDEVQSGDGISGIHRDWQIGDYGSKGISKNKLFREKLLLQITRLSDKAMVNLQHVPLLISGMASSSIGLEEVAYAGLPFSLDGSQVKSKKISSQPDFPHEIILISGVKSDHDVMRGEETQLIGIWSLLAERHIRPGEAIVIFPGTHSKHIYVKDSQLIHFKTFMTGEMYQVIGNHSILKDSVKMNYANGPSQADMDAFKSGIKDAQKSGILNSLFTVRTNQLFKRLNKTQNAFYLSGLLIGSELNDLEKKHDCQLFLCSGKKLYDLYKIALEELELSARVNFIASDLVEKAAMTGQKIIYDQYVNNKQLNG